MSINTRLPVTLQETTEGSLEFSMPYQTRRNQNGISIIDPNNTNSDPLNLRGDKLKKLVQGHRLARATF